MAKAVSHIVKRPGRRRGDSDVEIPVAEDLATVPGIPLREVDVSLYSRVEPLETQTIEKGPDRDWAWTVYSEEMAECGVDRVMVKPVKKAKLHRNVTEMLTGSG